MKLNLCPQKLQKLNEGWTFFHVPKQLLLWCLQTAGRKHFPGVWYVSLKAKISWSISEMHTPGQTFDKWLQTWSCCWLHAHQRWQWVLKPEDEKMGSSSCHVMMIKCWWMAWKRRKKYSYLWIEDRVKPIHIYLFTNKLQNNRNNNVLHPFWIQLNY